MAISPVLCKPPGIHKNKKDRRCMLIDVAVPFESNTSAKFRKKLSISTKICKLRSIRVRTGHGKPRKSWNLKALGSHGI